MEETRSTPQSGGEGQGTEATRTMMDVLDLPDAERVVVQFLLRQGETGVAELIAHTGQAEADLHVMLDDLTAKGFLGQGEGAETWRALLAQKRGRQTSRNLWAALDDL